ncbi:hypothetical protein COO60DRAFT_705597 [Scenedesmus sp. NREL 46B-D3]|nr:hypothetical protein COO60DRAFT_705597 [Scenedesmus sp. NREL 46B-D3]
MSVAWLVPAYMCGLAYVHVTLRPCWYYASMYGAARRKVACGCILDHSFCCCSVFTPSYSICTSFAQSTARHIPLHPPDGGFYEAAASLLLDLC